MEATYLLYKHKVSPEQADRGSRVYRLYLRKPVKIFTQGKSIQIMKTVCSTFSLKTHAQAIGLLYQQHRNESS